MLLVAASALVGVYLTEMRMPQQLASAILSLTENKYAILALLNVFFLVIGMFPAFGGGDHSGRSGRDAARHRCRDRPDPFRRRRLPQSSIGQQTPPVASVLSPPAPSPRPTYGRSLAPICRSYCCSSAFC
jgi:C4-dicarboxylate transporter, DctM subunit